MDYSMEPITMLPASVTCFDTNSSSPRISGGCPFPCKMTISPRRTTEPFEDARATMKKHLETRFTAQFLHNGPMVDDRPLYNQHQVRVLVDLVERLLFASASSLDEYSEISTLDERFRYIVTRFLQKKLQARKDHNQRKRFLASALASKEKRTSYKERTALELSEVQRSFQRLNIRSTRAMGSTTSSTRSKVSIWRPGLRERKF